MPHFGDYQNEIYGAGLRGVLPKLPVDYATLVQRATAAMPPHVLNYVQGGAATNGRRTGTPPRFAIGAWCRG